MRQKSTQRTLFGRVLLSIVMIAIACSVALPFYYIVVNTFKTQLETAESPLGLPSSLSLTNYKEVFATVPVWHSLLNTVYVTFISVPIMITIGAMAAYGIVMRKTASSGRMHLGLILAFAVPFQVTLLPIYRLFVKFHLVDNLNGLILLYCSGAMVSYLLIQGYMSKLPFEMVEAARVDGARPWVIFWRIIIPMIRPVLVTVGIFQTIWVWNDFLMANTFISSPGNYTLVLQVYGTVGQFQTDWPAFMTLTVLSLIPLAAFFMIAQRQIVGGLVAGAVKG